VRILSTILVLLVLSACQSAQPITSPVREDIPGPPIAYPAEAKRRLIAIAVREWQEFGAPEIDYSSFVPQTVWSGVPEGDPRVFPNILAYWNAVRTGWETYIRDQKTVFQGSGGGAWTTEAWSAVFISYLMRSAGIDRDDFPWSAGHRNYIDDLIQRHAAYGSSAVFQVYDIEQAPPRPGDLVCADRSAPRSRRLASVADRAAEIGSSRGMHCDLVVDVQSGRIGAIGGNVGQSVTKSWFPTDSYGRLLRRHPPEQDSERTFFAVIRTAIPDSPVAVPYPGS
jgi:hypothetical protein